MPERDMTEKHLEGYNDVFADVVNVLLFGGKRRVKPEDLKDTRARTFYKTDGKLHEQERDISKLWVSEGAVLAPLQGGLASPGGARLRGCFGPLHEGLSLGVKTTPPPHSVRHLPFQGRLCTRRGAADAVR